MTTKSWHCNFRAIVALSCQCYGGRFDRFGFDHLLLDRQVTSETGAFENAPTKSRDSRPLDLGSAKMAAFPISRLLGSGGSIPVSANDGSAGSPDELQLFG